MQSLGEQKQMFETSESFCPLRQRDENSIQSPVTLTKISELANMLNHKRTVLREARLETEMLKGKIQQQDSRMDQIKSEFFYSSEKEEVRNIELARNGEQIENYEQEIEVLRQKIEELRDLCAEKYHSIKFLSHEKECLIKKHRNLDANLSEFRHKKENVENQNIQLESIIDINSGQIRKVNQSVKEHEINQTDLYSEILTLNTKTNLAQKELNSQHFKQKQINDAIRGVSDKINTCHFSLKDRQFEAHQIEVQNDEIHKINQKLKSDLEAVQGHLQSLQKVNDLLKRKVEEYSRIARKVIKVVTANEKTH